MPSKPPAMSENMPSKSLPRHQPSAVKDEDTNEVDWDGPRDPGSPLNWPAYRRWSNVILVALMALIT